MQLLLGRVCRLLSQVAMALSAIACTSTLPTAVEVDRPQNLALPQSVADVVSHAFHALDRQKYAAQGLLDNPAVHDLDHRTRLLFARLRQHVIHLHPDADNWPWEIHVVDRGVVNAYASGAGKVMVYRGLIEHLALSEDELAFIVAHEMAHNLRLHMRENLSNWLPIQLVGVGLSQAVSPWGSAMVMDYGVAKPLSRTQEVEADRIGLELMSRAGFDPDAAQRTFEKFLAHEMLERQALAYKRILPRSTYLQTHPLSEERQADVAQQARHVTALYAQSNAYLGSDPPLSVNPQVNIDYLDGYEKLYLVGRIAPATVLTRMLHTDKDVSYGLDLGYGWMPHRTTQGGLNLHAGLSFFHGDPQVPGNFGGLFTEVGWVFGGHWQTYTRLVAANALNETALHKQKLAAGLRWGDYNSGHVYLEAGPARARFGPDLDWKNTQQLELGYAFSFGLF